MSWLYFIFKKVQCRAPHPTIPIIQFNENKTSSLICQRTFRKLSTKLKQLVPLATHFIHHLISFCRFSGLVIHTIIGLINSVIGLILAFLKAKQLSNFLTEIYSIDDDFYDLCETISIDYKKSFIFQLKCLIVSVLLFCFVGMFDYYVFQG